MTNGLYALASLDGSPLSAVDIDAMGLEYDTQNAPQPHLRTAEHCRVRAVDDVWAVGSIGFLKDAQTLTCLLGFLDEPGDLAAALGMTTAASPVELAALAAERFGNEVPLRITGEWTLIRWNAPRKELTVISSENCRENLYFATDGRRLAIAPDVTRLCGLAWVGQELDPIKMMLTSGRYRLRRMVTHETIWKGILSFLPSSTHTFSRTGQALAFPAPKPAPVLWEGSFEQGVEAIDMLGRRILRQQLDRYSKVAILLSGGLDSSIIAVWAALERQPDQQIVCISSAAAEGSGLADEREFSSAVAGQLGLPIEFVTPGPGVNVYQPSSSGDEIRPFPTVEVRHYLSAALERRVFASAARASINGGLGETSIITDKTPLPRRRPWPRRVASAARVWFADRQEVGGWPTNAFHVQWSQQMLRQVPPDWEGLWNEGPPQTPEPRSAEPSGRSRLFAKNAGYGTSMGFGTRYLTPFRDTRLVELAARMPKGFTHHGGVTRAVGRALLKDRVPDSVRLRPRGLPFSPDYGIRLQTDAPEAARRTAAFREAGLEKWLDIQWLESGLRLLAAGHDMTVKEQFKIQLTALTAEFLLQRNGLSL